MIPRSIIVSALVVSYVVIAFSPLSSPTASASNDDEPRPTALFSNNVKVNSGGLPYAWQVEPTMVVANTGLIHVGWKEANSDTGGGMRVSYSNSADGGQAWSPNILMATANPSARASDPWLIKDRFGRVHYTRLEYNSAGTLSGVTTSNTTNGITWGSSNYLNDMPNFADKETVAVDSAGVLYMAYNSNTVQNNMVFRKSYDGGMTWTSRVPIPDVQGNVIGAYVALDNFGRVFVAWTDFNSGNVLVDVSTDGGTTWGTDVRVNDVSGTVLDPLPTQWNITLPVVVVDAVNNVYVAWTDYRTANSYGDIYVARSRTNGASWDPAVRVNDYMGPAGQRMADMTFDSSGALHCAWYDHRHGGYDVYYSNSTDGGQTWSPNVRVTTVTTSRTYQRPGDYITIRTNPLDDNVYVVWTDGRGIDFDIYFAAMNGPVATQIIDTNPSGLLVIIDNITYIAPQVRNWAVGEVHEIGTFAVFNITPGSRYSFSSWNDGGPIVHNVVIAGPAIFIANFVIEYFLDVVSAYGMTGGSGWYVGGSLAIGCVSPNIVNLTPGSRVYVYGWGGDATGIGNCSDTVTMDQPKTIIAQWRTQYLVNASSPYGIVTGAGWYDDGNITNVSLDVGLVQIDQDERVRFINWSGDAQGYSLDSEPFVVDSPKMIIAVWTIQYLVNAISPYGVISGNGWFDEGNITILTLDTAFYQVGPNERAWFESWLGDASGTNLTSNPILVDSPKSAVAIWSAQYLLTITSPYGTTTGGGWIDDGSTTMALLDVGLVQINIDERVRFVFWAGDASGTSLTSNPILMNSPKTAVAVWQNEFRLTVVSDHGTPLGGGWYSSGSVAQVSIESIVDTGNGTRYIFIGWTGAINTEIPDASVTMSSAAIVVAQWRTEHLITVLSDHGNPTGDGWYSEGSTANISVQSTVDDTNGTWRFVSWDRDHSSMENATYVLVDGPKTIHANWERSTSNGNIPVGLDFFWIALGIVIAILVILLMFAFQRRKKEKDDEPLKS